jgi:hypothetical protein
MLFYGWLKLYIHLYKELCIGQEKAVMCNINYVNF